MEKNGRKWILKAGIKEEEKKSGACRHKEKKCIFAALFWHSRSLVSEVAEVVEW